jgi:competence protein ComEA
MGAKLLDIWVGIGRGIKSSAWTSLFGKVAAYLAGFAALAYVGSGGLSGLFSGAPGVSSAQAGVTSASAPAVSAAPPVHASHASHAAHAAHAAALPASTASSGGAAGAPSLPAADAGPPGDAGGGAITPDGKVILNLAGEEDLRRLPGIGPSKAKAIVELRAKLGKFRRAEDLLRVKGIGRKKLARLRPLLLIDPP